MKKYIPILLITSLLLSACSIDGSNKEDLFQKNQECIELEKNMSDQLNSNELYKGDNTSLKISMIFYSPVRNSCLYKSEFFTGNSTLLEINDFFTKEILYSTSCVYVAGDVGGYTECNMSVEKEIQRLKGE